MGGWPPCPRGSSTAPSPATSGFQLAAGEGGEEQWLQELAIKGKEEPGGRGDKGQGCLRPHDKGAGSMALSVSPVLVLGHSASGQETETLAGSSSTAHVSWKRSRAALLQPQCRAELLGSQVCVASSPGLCSALRAGAPTPRSVPPSFHKSSHSDSSHSASRPCLMCLPQKAAPHPMEQPRRNTPPPPPPADSFPPQKTSEAQARVKVYCAGFAIFQHLKNCAEVGGAQMEG